MKLRNISLQNFRQFHGAQEIHIASDPAKNLTLIHAENGIGKTTVLNALLWTFYGIVTKKFEQKERLVNFEALNERTNVASVEVGFEHEGTDYLAKRRFVQQTESRHEQELKVFRVDPNGSLKAVPAETFIQSVIPKGMAPYFFFDGEHAETFSAETNHRAVSQAIRDILGCSLAETAVKDLDYAARHYNKSIGGLPDAEDLAKIELQLEKLQNFKDKTEEELDALRNQRETAENQEKRILDQLRDAQAVKEIQARRDLLQRQLLSVAGVITKAKEETVRWIGSKSIILVAGKLAQQSLTFVDESSLRGKIPKPYNEDFVQGLLTSEVCICGRALPARSDFWRSVAELLKDASNTEILGKVVRARSRIRMFREQAQDTVRALQGFEEKAARAIEERRELEKEIGEIGKRLEELPLGEIADRERARKKLGATIRELDMKTVA